MSLFKNFKATQNNIRNGNNKETTTKTKDQWCGRAEAVNSSVIAWLEWLTRFRVTIFSQSTKLDSW